MSFDCVVIGGGAAGMMAAIQCKENNMQTVIIEHTAKLGTKILKTGNGKCNFSSLELRLLSLFRLLRHLNQTRRI